jgi:hypothetical protein
MTYTRLTLAEFRSLFPAFTTLDDNQYDDWLAKAERRVGENWGDEQQDATEFLTAHLLAVNGVGVDAGAAVLAATGATSFKSGAFSASVSEAVVTKRAKGGYQATVWGQQFAEIQRRLFGGPYLVGC